MCLALFSHRHIRSRQGPNAAPARLLQVYPHVDTRVEEEGVLPPLLSDRAGGPMAGQDDRIVRQGEELVPDARQQELAVAAGQVEAADPPPNRASPVNTTPCP